LIPISRHQSILENISILTEALGKVGCDKNEPCSPQAPAKG